MGLNVGNLPVKQVYVGSTPVTAVYVGAKKVWPTDPRVVTLQTRFARYESPSGDLSLLSVLTSNGVARFTAPVTGSRDTWVDGAYTPAGGRISAGAEVEQAAAGAHVFTEII